jgi:hypothetical protein
VAGKIRSIENFNDLIGYKIRDFPACSIGPPPPFSWDPTEYYQVTQIYRPQNQRPLRSSHLKVADMNGNDISSFSFT